MKQQVKKILKKLLGKVFQQPFLEYPEQKRSFSQCGEDLIVQFIFNQLGITKPTYLDIGAHHPYYISNTALFYLNGSRGINIEPDPILFKEFFTERKEDINLNVGVGEIEGEADFYIIDSPTLNTFSKEQAEGYSKEGNYNIVKVEKISLLTLEQIINQYANNIFPDFLSLDAEGIDEIITAQIALLRTKPIVICVETISFSTTGNGIKNVELQKFLEGLGYMLYADTYINSIFVLEDRFKRKEAS